jgi:disease resistance protein RPM1
MTEAILLAVSNIGAVILNEAVVAVIDKLSSKVANIKEFPVKIKRIDIELKMMNDVIQDLGTTHLSNQVIKGWIGNVRKLAYHVEDVIDKYLYEAVKLKEEGSLHRVFAGSRHIKVFSKIVDEIIEIEGEIRHVKDVHSYWSNIVQFNKNELADTDSKRYGGCFPELVNDEDLVGIDENRSKLIEWLTTDEKESTVITVSGMGGLGKTTLVKNVYDREKGNFPDAHPWIVVSQAYDVVRKFIRYCLSMTRH